MSFRSILGKMESCLSHLGLSCIKHSTQTSSRRLKPSILSSPHPHLPQAIMLFQPRFGTIGWDFSIQIKQTQSILFIKWNHCLAETTACSFLFFNSSFFLRYRKGRHEKALLNLSWQLDQDQNPRPRGVLVMKHQHQPLIW